jgi:hypothetical protein
MIRNLEISLENIRKASEGVKKSEFEKNKTAPKGMGRLEKL